MFVCGCVDVCSVSSYGAPIVATYAGTGTVLGAEECFNEGAACGSTRGSQTIVITGQNFGSVELGNDLLVRYGSSGSELLAEGCNITVPHTQIQCFTVPGAGARLKWSVLIDSLMSEAPTTAYDVPRVTSIEGPGAVNASTYGGELVVVRGSNFGPRFPSPDENATRYFEKVPQGLGRVAGKGGGVFCSRYCLPCPALTIASVRTCASRRLLVFRRHPLRMALRACNSLLLRARITCTCCACWSVNRVRMCV
jgi:hypothetical protein